MTHINVYFSDNISVTTPCLGQGNNALLMMHCAELVTNVWMITSASHYSCMENVESSDFDTMSI